MSQQASNVAVAQVSDVIAPVSDASVASAFTQLSADALPADYVENDPAQRSAAQIAHLCGLFGIVGTGIFYLVKKNDPAAAKGTFLRDQMTEAFNFHLAVFLATFAINILSIVAAMAIGIIGSLIGLLVLVVVIGAIVLSVMNAMKAGKGLVARYPARINVLK